MIKNNQLYFYNIEPKKNKIYKYYQNEESDSFTIGPYKDEDNISYFSLDTDFEKYLGEFVKHFFKINSETKDKKIYFYNFHKTYSQISDDKFFYITKLHNNLGELIYEVINELNMIQLDKFVENTKKHIELLYDICKNKLNYLQSINIPKDIKRYLEHPNLKNPINVSNFINKYIFDNIYFNTVIYDKKYLKYFNELNNYGFSDEMYKIIISHDVNNELDADDKKQILSILKDFYQILNKYIISVCLNQYEFNYENYENTKIINMKINNVKLNDNLKLIIPKFNFFESYSVYTSILE